MTLSGRYTILSLSQYQKALEWMVVTLSGSTSVSSLFTVWKARLLIDLSWLPSSKVTEVQLVAIRNAYAPMVVMPAPTWMLLILDWNLNQGIVP